MTRIIIINPNDKTVEERELSFAFDAHAAHIREIIGANFECAAFTVPRDSIETFLYVDSDGLEKPNKYFALIGWGTQEYAGIGVLSGVDRQGDTVSTNLTVAEVLQRIVFYD